MLNAGASWAQAYSGNVFSAEKCDLCMDAWQSVWGEKVAGDALGTFGALTKWAFCPSKPAMAMLAQASRLGLRRLVSSDLKATLSLPAAKFSHGKRQTLVPWGRAVL